MSKIHRITIRLARLGYCLGCILLLAGMILSLAHSPVRAAGLSAPAQLEEPPPVVTEEPPPVITEELPPAITQEPLPVVTEEPTIEVTEVPPTDEPPTETPTGVPACFPPDNWDSTIRLFHSRTSSKEWHFEVDEPEMDVTLVFFYYQDYEKNGCPKDCSTVKCQTDEIGEGDTPLGSFSVSDGNKGASDGKEKLRGRLPKGSYTASFHVTGKGSINIGMKVQKDSVPTETPLPTNTPTLPSPSPTPTKPAATPTATLPPGTPTATLPPGTPTATALPGTPTATPDQTVIPPQDTPTATPEENIPTATDPPSRPHKSLTATATRPPATLSPPTPPPGTALPPALVPVTGGDHSPPSGPLAQPGRLLASLGIGLLGLSLIFHGVSRRLEDS